MHTGGILCSGDPDPPPTIPADYVDYRGLATESDVMPLVGGTFSLGTFLDGSRGPRQDLGVTFDTLRRHAAIVGSTGSGKTRGVLIPWIATALRSGASVIAVDIGGDLLSDLARFAQSDGRIGVSCSKWDYSDPANSSRWSWLRALDSDEAIVAAVDATHGKVRPNDPQPYFDRRDAGVLRGLIQLAIETGAARTGRELLALLRDQQRLEDLAYMHPRSSAVGLLSDVLGLPAGEYQRAVSGIMNDLEIWDHDGLETVTATEEGIDLDLVLTQPHLLFLGSPLFGGRISEASSALLLSQLIHRLYRRPSAPYGVHVFRVKEEVARLASRLPLEELLSVSRESGVSVILALQDVAQFEDENERLAILGNCSTYVGMPTGSIASGKYLMDRLGDRFQSSFAVTQSSNTAFSGGWSKSRNISTVPVLGGREIMEPAVGQRPAIVHSPQLVPKPILVDLYRPEWA